MSEFETRTHIEETIIKVYPYGSLVYGSATPDSDSDFIVVVESDDSSLYYSVQEDDADYTVYSEKRFIQRIQEHHISALECIFQSDNDPFIKYFKLNHEALRREISAVASNSFVKCKKKMRDGEDYIGRKSMFHSLRILMFGIQIAEHGRITDYKCANQLLETIMSCSNWNAINAVCKPKYNQMKSEFKILAPLESEKNDSINEAEILQA